MNISTCRGLNSIPSCRAKMDSRYISIVQLFGIVEGNCCEEGTVQDACHPDGVRSGPLCSKRLCLSVVPALDVVGERL